MYKKKTEGWLKHYDFVILDMVCLQIAYVLAYGLAGYGFNPYGPMVYRSMAIVMVLANAVVTFSLDTFKDVLRRGYYVEFTRTIQHAVGVCGLSILYLFMVQQGQLFSRLTLGLTFVIYIPLTYAIRQSWKKTLGKKMEAGDGESLLIVTSSDIAQSVLENLKQNNYSRYRIAGVALIDKDIVGQEIAGVPVVANRENAPMYICQEWVDEVLIVPKQTEDFPEHLYSALIETGVTVHMNLAKLSKVTGRRQFVEKIGNYNVLTTSINYASSRQLLIKRLMDIAGGLVGCVITAIVFIFVAPMIYISSPGPIFFAQERVGKNGKKFKIYKFRSMYMDAEERKAELMKDNKLGDAKMFKLDFDPRVIGNKVLPDGTEKTGVGEFIRKTSLDEFPQFFNVLKGDMSIVGTRPPLMSEVSEYELHHRARLAIKPGITGMWQVSGRSDITDFEEVVRLDMDYIDQWTVGLDIKILLKTIQVVMKREGAS